LPKHVVFYNFLAPPRYGYGKNGVGSAIAPNSTLIFEFELLGIGDIKMGESYIDDL
jgi:hypothetical protein